MRSLDESFQRMVSNKYGVNFNKLSQSKSIFESLDECDKKTSDPAIAAFQKRRRETAAINGMQNRRQSVSEGIDTNIGVDKVIEELSRLIKYRKSSVRAGKPGPIFGVLVYTQPGVGMISGCTNWLREQGYNVIRVGKEQDVDTAVSRADNNTVIILDELDRRYDKRETLEALENGEYLAAIGFCQDASNIDHALRSHFHEVNDTGLLKGPARVGSIREAAETGFETSYDRTQSDNKFSIPGLTNKIVCTADEYKDLVGYSEPGDEDYYAIDFIYYYYNNKFVLALAVQKSGYAWLVEDNFDDSDVPDEQFYKAQDRWYSYGLPADDRFAQPFARVSDKVQKVIKNWIRPGWSKHRNESLREAAGEYDRETFFVMLGGPGTGKISRAKQALTDAGIKFKTLSINDIVPQEVVSGLARVGSIKEAYRMSCIRKALREAKSINGKALDKKALCKKWDCSEADYDRMAAKGIQEPIEDIFY